MRRKIDEIRWVRHARRKKNRAWRLFWLLQIVLLSGIGLSVSARHSLTVQSILVRVGLGTVFTDTYDTATPLGTDAPSVIDDRIREVKGGVQERQNVDHYWPLSGTQVSDADAGEHRKVLFHAPIAATPTVALNHGDLRIKDVSAKAELTWTDEDENELVITDAGTLNIVSADLVGTLANNTYLSAVDNAGTSTVDLIKADGNDVAVVPDNSQTATSAAPTSSTGITNKTYVDNRTTMVPAITGAGTGYTGGESVTFANGLIFKQGQITVATGATGTVTYGAAFPTAFVSANACYGEVAAQASPVSIEPTGGSTKVSLRVKNNHSAQMKIYWQAWGY